jgi:hypothetical protein
MVDRYHQMTMIFARLAAFAYTVYYWNDISPPSRDVISPLVMLSMMGHLVFENEVSYRLLSCLFFMCLDMIADYRMSPVTIKSAISMFAVSHLFKQAIFMNICGYDHSHLTFPSSLFMASLMMTVALLLAIAVNDSNDSIISYYGFLLVFTYLQLCYLTGGIFMPYFFFAVSDAIIGFEMAFGTINPRQIRIVLVPFLFWLATQNTAKQIMQLNCGI